MQDKFRVSAKLVSITLGGASFQSDEKSGHKFKMITTLEDLGLAEAPEGFKKSIGHAMAGELELEGDGGKLRINLCAMQPEYEYGDKNRFIIKCEAKAPFNDSEILFLKNHQGSELTTHFKPSQRTIPFADENENEKRKEKNGNTKKKKAS